MADVRWIVRVYPKPDYTVEEARLLLERLGYYAAARVDPADPTYLLINQDYLRVPEVSEIVEERKKE